MRLARLLVHGLCLASALSACLPQAGPGEGERVVEGRGLAMLSVSRWPSQSGAARPIFFSRANPSYAVEPGSFSWDAHWRDLMVKRPDRGDPELALPHYDWGAGVLHDPHGRVFVPLASAGVRGSEAVRSWKVVDLQRALVEDMGRLLPGTEISPGGTLLVYTPEGGLTVVRTLATDAERRMPDQLRSPVFVDEVMYANDGQRLWRVRPDDGEPEVVALNVRRHQLLSRAGRPPVMITVTGAADSRQETVRLLPLDTGASEPLGTMAANSVVVPSPDGTELALVQPDAGDQVSLRVVTLEPRSDRGYRVAIPQAPVSGPGSPPTPGRPSGSLGARGRELRIHYRPGTLDIWAIVRGRLAILHPDGSVELHDGSFERPAVIHRLPGRQIGARTGFISSSGLDSMFTSDGRLWGHVDANGVTHVRSADDPGGASLLQMGKSGEALSLGELPAAERLLAWDTAGLGNLDVRVHDSRTLALLREHTDVSVAVFGERRALAIDDTIVSDFYAPGRLVMLDLDSGAETRLAGNVTEFRPFVQCPGCDPTIPGAGIAYVVHARVPWRHDGIWVATLP